MRIPLSSSTPVTLVGRERELGVLRDHLNAALTGHGSLVLIGGEAGIGKTALAEALGNEATERGAHVLVGRCFDLSESPPYGPWIELFKQYPGIDATPPLPPAFSRRGTVGAVPDQAALLQQVEDFFSALGTSRPLFLLLDDLHWADPASLDLLRFLARATPALPMLVLATFRSDELTRRHPLSRLLPAFVREANAARLDLRALDDRAVRALVTPRYRLHEEDTARLVAYLRGHAEGNVLFVGELLRALEEGGILAPDADGWHLGNLAQASVPALLRQLIDARVARLDAQSQRLLAVAAVIGHAVPLDVWATVTGTDEDAILSVVEQGLDARLLVAGGDDSEVRFAHALIREAVYEGLPGIRRRRIHRRVAETLADARGPDPDAVAYHFQRADDARALPWLLRTGERAQGAYAWVTAAQRFEAAHLLMERADADPVERGWLLLRVSRLLRYVEVAKARTFADEALALAWSADAGALAACARFQRGLLALFAGDMAGGLPELEAGAEATSALSETGRADFAAHAIALTLASPVPELGGTVAMWRAEVGRYHAARELGEKLIAAVADGDEEALQGMRDGLVGLAHSYAALGMPDRAAAMYTRAYDAYLRGGHRVLASQASMHEAIAVALPYRTEDIAGRRLLLERAEAEDARASGALPALLPPRFVWLPLLVLEGRWEEAERLAAAGSAVELGIRIRRMTALQHLALLARLRGDPDRAWWAVRELLPLGSETAPGTVHRFDRAVAVQQTAVSLALDAGDLGTAKEWLEATDRWLAWAGAVRGQSEREALWARYHRQAGDRDNACAHAERALVLATEPRQPLALLAAHRLLAEFDTEAGRFESAAGHLDAARRLADACEAPFERALTLLTMAELDAARGVKSNAHTLLGAVRAICEPLGAQPALARADALVRRLIADAPATPTYPAGLSAREVEVLRLVAEGLSNPQIGGRLFVSPRTVEQHLRSIFNKTGVPSRAAAARWAAEHGLA